MAGQSSSRDREGGNVSARRFRAPAPAPGRDRRSRVHPEDPRAEAVKPQLVRPAVPRDGGRERPMGPEGVAPKAPPAMPRFPTRSAVPGRVLPTPPAHGEPSSPGNVGASADAQSSARQDLPTPELTGWEPPTPAPGMDSTLLPPISRVVPYTSNLPPAQRGRSAYEAGGLDSSMGSPELIADQARALLVDLRAQHGELSPHAQLLEQHLRASDAEAYVQERHGQSSRRFEGSFGREVELGGVAKFGEGVGPLAAGEDGGVAGGGGVSDGGPLGVNEAGIAGPPTGPPPPPPPLHEGRPGVPLTKMAAQAPEPPQGLPEFPSGSSVSQQPSNVVTRMQRYPELRAESQPSARRGGPSPEAG